MVLCEETARATLSRDGLDHEGADDETMSHRQAG